MVISSITPAFASAERGKVHIIQLDPALPIEKFSAPGFQVHPLVGRNIQSTPLPNLREALLEEAGLTKQTQDWDHFKKDLLMQKLQHQPVAKVAGHYPKLPREALAKLKSMFEVFKKRKAHAEKGSQYRSRISTAGKKPWISHAPW